jgi:hypothetical protein
MLPYLFESTIGVAMSKVRRGLAHFTTRAFSSPLGDRCRPIGDADFPA